MSYAIQFDVSGAGDRIQLSETVLTALQAGLRGQRDVDAIVVREEEGQVWLVVQWVTDAHRDRAKARSPPPRRSPRLLGSRSRARSAVDSASVVHSSSRISAPGGDQVARLRRAQTTPAKPRSLEEPEEGQSSDGNGDQEPQERLHALLMRLEGVHLSADVADVLGWEGVSGTNDTSLLHAAADCGVIVTYFPLHNKEQRNDLRRLQTRPPVQQLHGLKAYFGSKVMFYHAWLNFYTMWLIPPAVIGLLLWIREWFGGEPVDNVHCVLYAAAMTLWSSLFLCYWSREENRLRLQWNLWELDAKETLRYEFRATDSRISPVTGEVEGHFPSWKRWLRICGSLVVVAFMLCLAVLAMLACLNMDGYMEPDDVFYIAIFNSRNPDKPGMVYDSDPILVQFFPTILHSILIFTLNMLYSQVATQLTEFENYRTQEEFDRSLIGKRVPFEMFDCFLSLFYLAFWKRAVTPLRHELLGLFLTDTVRRITVESLIPYAQEHFSFWRMSKNDKSQEGKRKKSSKQQRLMKQIRKEVIQPEYVDFDDYIEMVTQFGYITFFAAAFPLASTLALIANVIEGRSDIFKLLYVHQRPHPHKAPSGIGIWFTVLRWITLTSVITNCAIFAFTSNQVETVFLGDNAASMIGGHEATCLFVMFTTEHVILLIQHVMESLIPSIPGDVRVALARRQYEQRRATTAQ